MKALISRNKQFFEKIAPSFGFIYPDQKRGYELLVTYLKKEFKYNNVGKNLLDIGCGNSVLVNLIAKKFPKLRCYGMDISKNFIYANEAKNKRKNVSYILGNCFKLEDYGKDKYDIITCLGNTLSHYPAILYNKLFQNIHRKLNEGGTLIIDTYSDWSKIAKQTLTLNFRGLVISKNSAEVTFFVDDLSNDILNRVVYHVSYKTTQGMASKSNRIRKFQIKQYKASLSDVISYLKGNRFTNIEYFQIPVLKNILYLIARKY